MDNPEKKDPAKEFNQFLEQALTILKDVLVNVDVKPINPDAPLDKIVTELLQIERQLDEFIDVNKDLLESSRKESLEKPVHSKETLRLLKKTAELQGQAEKKREWLSEKKTKAEAKAKTKGEAVPKAEAPTTAKETARKNKFRRVGGSKKNWKPL